MIAIEEADVILFLVEVGTGITDFDEEIADILRRSDKPVLLVVNKVDSADKRFDSYQFYSLGLGDPWDISSANGSGTGDMLDRLVSMLPDSKEEEDKHAGVPRIAIVGRPNAGKSSITNAFLGEERNIVTPVAGTTRDAVESYYNKFGHEFILVDTAGLRKKSKVNEDLGHLHPDDRCPIRSRGSGYVHLQSHPAQQQRLRGGGQQMGPDREQDRQHHEGIRRGHTQAARAFQRYPRHLHIGHQKAKNPRCAGRGGQGL